MHHLHIIIGEDKREIRDSDFENIKVTHDLLVTKSAYDWQHIVWTNNKMLMPNSLKKLVDIGVQVNELDHYKHSLPKYNLIQKNIAISDVGKTVDIAKLSVIYKFGGVYADLNYKFFKTLDAEICTFNFLTTSLDDSYQVENFFFIASKKHPILVTSLNDIERNLSLKTTPAWLHLYYEHNATTCDVSTDLFTYRPFMWSIYKAGHINGNIDAVYPPSKISNLEPPEDYFAYNTTLDFILNTINALLDDSSSQFVESCIKDEEYEESDYNLGMQDNLLQSCMAHYPFENKFFIGEDGNHGGSWTT